MGAKKTPSIKKKKVKAKKIVNEKKKCDCKEGTCTVGCGKSGKDCKSVTDCNNSVQTGEHYKISYYRNSEFEYLPQIKSNKQPLSNWINQQSNGPVAYYNKIIEMYGDPYIIINKPHGLCIWNKFPKDDPHIRIELKDEFVPHCVPANHNDFFYSYVKIYIPPKSLNAVQSISGSVNYDPLKHELFARCASFEANYATLRTVFDTLDKTSTNYSKNITKKDQDMLSNKEYVSAKVKENQKKYKKELTWEYYPGAFPEGCPK